MYVRLNNTLLCRTYFSIKFCQHVSKALNNQRLKVKNYMTKGSVVKSFSVNSFHTWYFLPDNTAHNFSNSAPCKGLVIISAIMSAVGICTMTISFVSM